MEDPNHKTGTAVTENVSQVSPQTLTLMTPPNRVKYMSLKEQ